MLGRGAVRPRPDVTAAALEPVYQAFYLRLVRRVTWRFRLSKEDASEVVQDAFIVALEKLDMEKDPSAWLYRTVDNLALNWRRKLDRRARLTAEWARVAERQENEESEGGSS